MFTKILNKLGLYTKQQYQSVLTKKPRVILKNAILVTNKDYDESFIHFDGTKVIITESLLTSLEHEDFKKAYKFISEEAKPIKVDLD